MSKRARAEKLVGKKIRDELGIVGTVVAVEVEWASRTSDWGDAELADYDREMTKLGKTKDLCLKLQDTTGLVLWRKVNSRVRYEVVT